MSLRVPSVPVEVLVAPGVPGAQGAFRTGGGVYSRSVNLIAGEFGVGSRSGGVLRFEKE